MDPSQVPLDFLGSGDLSRSKKIPEIYARLKMQNFSGRSWSIRFWNFDFSVLFFRLYVLSKLFRKGSKIVIFWVTPKESKNIRAGQIGSPSDLLRGRGAAVRPIGRCSSTGTLVMEVERRGTSPPETESHSQPIEGQLENHSLNPALPSLILHPHGALPGSILGTSRTLLLLQQKYVHPSYDWLFQFDLWSFSNSSFFFHSKVFVVVFLKKKLCYQFLRCFFGWNFFFEMFHVCNSYCG